MALRAKGTRKVGPAKRAGSDPAAKRSAPGKWSAKVTRTSDALTLRSGVFKLKSARAVASSLQKSAEASHRRKSSPFRSAMSMLTFEINRAGTNLSSERIRVLNESKEELRKLFARSRPTKRRSIK